MNGIGVPTTIVAVAAVLTACGAATSPAAPSAITPTAASATASVSVATERPVAVTTPEPTPDPPGIGEEGRVHIAGNRYVLLATTKDNYEEMAKAFAARDTVGLEQMVLLGRAFFVNNDTRVLVIDSAGFLVQQRRVRILEGPEKDRSGWIDSAFVIR